MLNKDFGEFWSSQVKQDLWVRQSAEGEDRQAQGRKRCDGEQGDESQTTMLTTVQEDLKAVFTLSTAIPLGWRNLALTVAAATADSL